MTSDDFNLDDMTPEQRQVFEEKLLADKAHVEAALKGDTMDCLGCGKEL